MLAALAVFLFFARPAFASCQTEGLKFDHAQLRATPQMRQFQLAIFRSLIPPVEPKRLFQPQHLLQNGLKFMIETRFRRYENV